MKMNQKGFANIILVVVIVILVGAVGYFVFVKKSEPIAQQPTSITTQRPATQSPTPTQQGNTVNQKIYSVPGMRFEYPDTWQVKTGTSGVRTTATFVVPENPDDFYGEVFMVSYAPNQGGLTLEEWWSEASKSDRYQKSSETTIAGFSAYVLALPETDAPPRYIFITKSRAPGGWIYDITARGENVKKVLATFRSTE